MRFLLAAFSVGIVDSKNFGHGFLLACSRAVGLPFTIFAAQLVRREFGREFGSALLTAGDDRRYGRKGVGVFAGVGTSDVAAITLKNGGGNRPALAEGLLIFFFWEN
ncbi:78 kDa glucose-regulated protein [Striga asiatica]|uniref:78 kDa glucose-regulated protein n=1 Tax=Striga asiatica TaxID=4170 RepID=A0A5A7P6B3_STRAF|nr:78 kDa glucose-regulated protein [Striga asiatica]